MAEITDEELEQLRTTAHKVPELESQIATLKQEQDTERTALLGHYIEALATANPLIPRSAFSGDSVEAINSSLATAVELAKNIQANIANAPKQQMGFQPANAQGTRTPVDTTTMSAAEKIRYGLQNP